ncbi:unnamed protein product [Closterium sp. NIES-64]|nr:unnamed protein product [Closterium sp. NIES-64]
MVAMFAVEVVLVQFVTVVVGIDWHNGTPPLPDTGQWLLLALNDHLPAPLTALLRARLVELHDFLMLFMLLAFSVLFNCIPPSGIGLGARYCFTIGLSRLLRFLTFASTILPAVRPWCAAARFGSTSPRHPHPWAQKYFVPYATNHDMLHEVISTDVAFAPQVHYPPEYQPDWGAFQFLVDFLRPMNARAHHGAAASSGAFSSFVIRPYGGCNDLAFSGHIIVAALTACAWQEAFPGWASAMVWGLVFHSAQREVRERQHYSVDVVIALYLAPLLWRTTRFLWSHPPAPPTRREAFGAALSEREAALMKALKDGDLGAVREAVGDAVEEAEGVVSGGVKGKTAGDKAGKDAQTNRLLLPFGIGFPLLRVARKVLNLGTIGLAYVLIEFVCTRTDWLPPHVAAKFPLALWAFLGILGVVQSQRYRHFADEFRNVPKFLACVGFMLLAFVVEVIAVQFVTVVLGLDWHKTVTPLPDTGQWILLGLNDRLPAPLTALLRAPIVEMHDFIMLFMLLAFSVLVGAIPGPGMALGSRYVFSIGLSRILRVATFSSTILPAPRPWCAESRFGDTCPRHPHPWAAKYLTPYSDNPDLLHQLISTDTAFAGSPVVSPKFCSVSARTLDVLEGLVALLPPMDPAIPVAPFSLVSSSLYSPKRTPSPFHLNLALTGMSYPPEFRPDWGSLQFLVDFLRPMDARVHDGAAASSGAFSSFVVRPYGGCNDLAFSGHIVVAALTACAWQEAHPGWGSAMVWVLVMHAAQRDIRERSHYSVDVIIALYLAPLLWQITRFLWSRPAPPPSRKKLMGLALADREAELVKAVKEGDLDRVKWTVEMARREADAKEKGGEVEGGVEAGNAERRTVTQRYLAHLGTVLILTMLGVVLVAILVSDEGHKAVLEKK